MRCLALILLAGLLAGCKSDQIVVPKIVHVPVQQIVGVPDELSRDCDEVKKRDNTIGEAVRLANARLESLKACNADKAKIRALGSKP